MTYAELVQLYFERSNALQWYWTLYVVIVGGLLAFSSLRAEGDLVTTILITILFAFFAYKNTGSILEVSDQRLAILGALKSYTTEPGFSSFRANVEPTLQPVSHQSTHIFHLTSDLLTIAALWAFERRRRKST